MAVSRPSWMSMPSRVKSTVSMESWLSRAETTVPMMLAEHDGDDDTGVPGHLKEQEDGGERGMGRGGQEGADADCGIGARWGGDRGKQGVGDPAEGSAGHGPDKEGRGKDPAGTAGAQGDGGGDDLEEDQAGYQAHGGIVVQYLLDEMVAVAHDLGKEHGADPDQQGAEDGFQLRVQVKGRQSGRAPYKRR